MNNCFAELINLPNLQKRQREPENLPQKQGKYFYTQYLMFYISIWKQTRRNILIIVHFISSTSYTDEEDEISEPEEMHPVIPKQKRAAKSTQKDSQAR